MLIRYCNDKVVAIIDPHKAGKTAKQVLGWGGDIPCVSSFKETIEFSPTHLVIGSAPQGGTLDLKELLEIQNVENVENAEINNSLIRSFCDDSEFRIRVVTSLLLFLMLISKVEVIMSIFGSF